MNSNRDRRRVIAGLLGGLAALWRNPAGALSAGPPLFESARHQFTIIRPATMVTPLELTRIDGSRIWLSSFLGKVVLINIWATWCPACQIDLPILERLQNDATIPDLHVVAISVDRDSRAAVSKFLHRLNIRHLDVYCDPDGSAAHVANAGRDDPFPIYAMPISYVIGRTGRVEGYMIGQADWSSDQGINLLRYYAEAEMPER